MPFGNAAAAINIIGAAQEAQQKVVKEMMTIVGRGKNVGAIIHLSYGEVGLA